MANFYRIETKDGVGMYNSGIVRNLGLQLYDVGYVKGHFDREFEIGINFKFKIGRHPLPVNDTKLIESLKHAQPTPLYNTEEGLCLNFNHRFGFSSIQQLHAWLYDNKWLRALHHNGLQLTVYSGTVYDGNTQAIIDISDPNTKKVEVRTLLSLIEILKRNDDIIIV